jgi:Protein of unknown function with PCYCGC motif
MRRVVIYSSSFAAVVALAWLLPALVGSAARNNSARGATCIGGHCCCTGRAEAGTEAPKGSQPRLTLDPKQFVGPVRQAYQFAADNPAMLAELHCYCGCDKAEGHQSLLDCYRGMHGASCEICTSEALMAKRMSEQGSPVDQIRDALRRNFAQDN